MIKGILLGFLFVYKKVISPLLPPSCRFYPTCSDYAFEAVNSHGVLKGVSLAARRLVKCHPYNDGGYDPVPHSCNLKTLDR